MIPWSQRCDPSALLEDMFHWCDVTVRSVRGREVRIGLAVAVAGAGILMWKCGPDLRHRYFAWINNKFTDFKQQDNQYEDFKSTAFATLKDITSHDPKLREENALRILEIGAGIGTNFKMYPDNTRLIVADPNPYFEKYFMENKAKFPNIKIESILVVKGEDIDMVKSSSVDVVVTTLVLCSVSDIAKVVSQIKRVLVPGGKYIFVEHVKEWDRKTHRTRSFFQTFLTWIGLWPFIFDNCRLNRNPLPDIESVGFCNICVEQQYAPMPFGWMTLASPHLKGVATK